MIQMMYNSILRKFSQEVRERGVFGIIADETADVSQVEQLSICIRSVDKELVVEEKLIGLHAMDSCDGNSIFMAIEDFYYSWE